MCSSFQGFHSQTGSKDVIFKILHLNTVTNKDMRLPLKKKKYSANSMQGLILEEISRKRNVLLLLSDIHNLKICGLQSTEI